MTVRFSEAKVGQQAHIYKCPPGDEYGWVEDAEYFDDWDDPVRTVRQRWMLIDEEDIIIHPRIELCPTCHGDEVVDGATCPTCDGSGAHPLEGQIEVMGGDETS